MKPPMNADERRCGTPATTHWDSLDQHPACFDKLSMRLFLSAGKIPPHPEPVEGRTMGLQARAKRIGVHRRSSAVSIFSAFLRLCGSPSIHV
jgi:hypothetical protein